MAANKDSGSSGPSNISDPELVRLTDSAIQHVMTVANTTPDARSPPHVAEALYLKATLSASGSFPTYLPKDPRSAFKDFEMAARQGYAAAWFKLGRDYETLNDPARAKDCFERGAKLSEKSCLYVSHLHFFQVLYSH